MAPFLRHPVFCSPLLQPKLRPMTGELAPTMDGCGGCGWGPITRRSFPREAFPRYDTQGYVSARCDSRAETYPCAS